MSQRRLCLMGTVLVKALLAALWLGMAAAAESVSVVGLFQNKALLQIDNERKLLGVGAEHAGVRVLGIDGQQVRLTINGETKALRFGENVAFSTQFKPVESEQVLILRSDNGMYLTSGAINGIPVQFLVDTGANVMGLNSAHARQIGIKYEDIGVPVAVQTAAGMIRAYHVMLDSVRVGGIEVRNVMAVVAEGAYPATILLGMSFLGQIEVRHDGPTMLLQQRW